MKRRAIAELGNCRVRTFVGHDSTARAAGHPRHRHRPGGMRITRSTSCRTDAAPDTERAGATQPCGRRRGNGRGRDVSLLRRATGVGGVPDTRGGERGGLPGTASRTSVRGHPDRRLVLDRASARRVRAGRSLDREQPGAAHRSGVGFRWTDHATGSCLHGVPLTNGTRRMHAAAPHRVPLRLLVRTG